MDANRRPSRLVLLGHPVAHSLSPVFQNAALQEIGSTLRYELLDVAPPALDGILDAFANGNVAGNATIPHKHALAARARCTPLARRVGAVNTFWHENGVLCGDNTDVAGIAASVAALCPDGVTRMRASVLGAGGAAAAALIALEQLGCHDIAIASRAPDRARALCTRVGVRARLASDAGDAARSADLVINATPMGMLDDTMPVEVDTLSRRAAVLDLVYRIDETPWVRAARDSGHPAADGLRMLVEQGAAAFERWFCMPAPKQVMWRALTARLGRTA
jgi:shikimate dehydrogenase